MRSFFKTLVEHEITVELKNEVQIRGTLKSVDQYLNIKLDNAEAVDEIRWPHLVCAPFFIVGEGIFWAEERMGRRGSNEPAHRGGELGTPECRKRGKERFGSAQEHES